jgi:CBS domain-containing protein
LRLRRAAGEEAKTMIASNQTFADITAANLMSHEPLVLLEDTSVRDAALALMRLQVSGAPVVDREGRCVGVLSTTDFVKRCLHPAPRPPVRRPQTCSFQTKTQDEAGHEKVLCQLPEGACPVQCREKTDTGEVLVCRDPHSVLADWQMVELESLPEEQVRDYMTADPVMVGRGVPLHELAQRMVDAHIHRIVVVDNERRPIGMVSSSDVLAVVAFARTPA